MWVLKLTQSFKQLLLSRCHLPVITYRTPLMTHNSFVTHDNLFYLNLSFLWASQVSQWLQNKQTNKQKTLHCRRDELDSWVRKIPWRREWQPTQYSTLENPWTEEPGRLQFIGSQRVRHDWMTKQQQCEILLFFIPMQRALFLSLILFVFQSLSRTFVPNS